jgi:DNA-directed RNA polymerase subunit RPC12/RpoP
MRRLRSIWLFVIAAAAIAVSDIRVGGQQPAKEYYQDFRNKRPLSEDFGLYGPDRENETRAENEGLRFTLGALRRANWPAEIRPKFALVGDFEFTATYEMFTAAQPEEGYGVGVNLTLAIREGNKNTTFAKISRVNRPKGASVYYAEAWSPEKNSYRAKAKPTDAMSGQLRLTRVGKVLKFFVSDGPGKEFEEIWELKNFGDMELPHNGFSVSDSGKPGNAVDARLIDLRVRMGDIQLEKAIGPAPLPAPVTAPNGDDGPLPAPQNEGSASLWLIVILAGVGASVLGVITVIAVLLLRRRPALATTTKTPARRKEAGVKTVHFSCASCGKKLKVKSELAGKKIKCPQCGNLVAVSSAS